MNTIISSQHIYPKYNMLVDNSTTHYKRVVKRFLPYGIVIALTSCAQPVMAQSNIIRDNIEKSPSIIIPFNISRNYKLPRNEEGIVSHKERRNKQRITDRDRNINPYKNYYQ